MRLADFDGWAAADSLAAEGRAMYTADLEPRLADGQAKYASLGAKAEGLERLIAGFKSSHASLKRMRSS